MRGFIKIDRKLLEWKYINSPNVLRVWLEVLLTANYECGELITTQAKLCTSTGLSSKQVRCAIKKLEECGAINVIKIKHDDSQSYPCSKIVINNWKSYQTSKVVFKPKLRGIKEDNRPVYEDNSTPKYTDEEIDSILSLMDFDKGEDK